MLAFIHCLFTILLINLNAYATRECQSLQSFDSSPCIAHISKIHPSQFAVGKYAIKYKTGSIENAWAENKLAKYLKKESNPAVYGPDQKLWIIDGHHFHYSLAKANIPTKLKRSYIHVIADFRNQSHEEFKNYMLSNNYVYLKDQDFNLVSFDELPSSISLMKNNPYRSLAWIVRKQGGFNKSEVFYAEFIWGEYFKNNGVILNDHFDVNKEQAALIKAHELARDTAASHLPGYKH